MLNGLADYIFGTRTNGEEQAGGNSSPKDTSCDDEWILISVKDTKNLEDEVKSSRSSPVFVADPEIGVMEASTFANLMGENQPEPDSEVVEGEERIVQRYDRRAVAELLQGNGSPGLPLRKQQTESKAKDLTQGKMKRANLVLEVKTTKKVKQRKSRVKNTSGRNNDRKCQ